MVSEKYKVAYTEVLQILNSISYDEFNKIPKSKIEFFKRNCKKNYFPQYDVSKTLEEQGFSKITKTIIAILFRDYFATEEQRKKILLMEKKGRM